MNCEPVQDRLSAYLDDELTGSEVGEVGGAPSAVPGMSTNPSRFAGHEPGSG